MHSGETGPDVNRQSKALKRFRLKVKSLKLEFLFLDSFDSVHVCVYTSRPSKALEKFYRYNIVLVMLRQKRVIGILDICTVHFQSLDAGTILPLQGVCDPVTGNTPLMYAAMENKASKSQLYQKKI